MFVIYSHDEKSHLDSQACCEDYHKIKIAEKLKLNSANKCNILQVVKYNLPIVSIAHVGNVYATNIKSQ